MEQLLRGQKISEIEEAGAGEAEAEVSEIEKAVCPGTEYDLSGPVLYFPIRHHSPVCSYHLQKAAEAYRPDCILIEGPENAEPLIRSWSMRIRSRLWPCIMRTRIRRG